MKCFLHIGTEKTATTTIQTFFARNRPALLQNGFLYTRSAGRLSNSALATAAYNPSRSDRLLKASGLSSPADLLAFRKTTTGNLRKEIDEVRGTGATVIFSAEQIQARLTQTDEVQRLRDILFELGIDEVSVIVYLRRPADIACSQMSSLLKLGMPVDRALEPDNPVIHHVCNHRATIERFEAVFGRSAMIPRIYDRKAFVDGSIIDDISQVIGIPRDADYELPDRQNESLSPLGVALLQRLNKSIPYWDGQRPNPLRSDLVSYVARHFSDVRFVMPRRLYEVFDATFRESDEWVRATYFPDREFLFSSEIPDETVLEVSDDAMDRLASFISSIWTDKQRDVIRLSGRRDAPQGRPG